MNLLDIVWPTIALVALIFVVWFTMALTRFNHMRANPPKPDDFADGASALRYFAPVEMPSNNLRNLFEMPILYFALVPLLIATGLENNIYAVLAWIFVLFRAVHSYVHIGPKKVQLRFTFYLLSCVVLAAMWIGFAVDMVKAS